jgi:hypothetical protein
MMHNIKLQDFIITYENKKSVIKTENWKKGNNPFLIDKLVMCFITAFVGFLTEM